MMVGTRPTGAAADAGWPRKKRKNVDVSQQNREAMDVEWQPRYRRGKATRGQVREGTILLTVDGESAGMVERLMGLLKSTLLLGRKQADDANLGQIRREMMEGGWQRAGGGTCLLHGGNLLWIPSQGQAPRLAIPRFLIPGVLALVHSTFGHLGVAKTTKVVGCLRILMDSAHVSVGLPCYGRRQGLSGKGEAIKTCHG